MRKKIKLAVLGISVTAVIAGSACNMADSNYKPMMEKASNYMKNEDIDSAFRCYDIASKLKPNEAAPMIKMADIYLTRQFYDKAEEMINQAITLAPDNAEVYRQQMKLYIAYEQGEEAYNALTRAKECGKPEITQEEYLQLGALLSNQGFADQAIGCFEEGSVENMTADQQISYWMALKAANRDDEIASLGLIEPGSEKMPANFDEQFQNGTIQLTKTQVGKEFFEQDERKDFLLMSASPDNRYAIFEKYASDNYEYFLYDFEQNKEVEIWADVGNSVEGTQENLIAMVEKNRKRLWRGAVWSKDSSYLVIDFNQVINENNSAFTDAYIVDPQTGGCRAVKYSGGVEYAGYPITFYCCATDNIGNVYYLEFNQNSGLYEVRKLNVETKADEKIAEIPEQWEYRRYANRLVYASGKLVGIFYDADTEEMKLVVWEQDNGGWKQSERTLCSYRVANVSYYSGNNQFLISDSGRGFLYAGKYAIVFDINSDEEPYALTGIFEDQNIEGFHKITVEEAYNDGKVDEKKFFGVYDHFGLSPDGRYILMDGRWTMARKEGDNSEIFREYIFVNLETAQMQQVEAPPKAYYWISWLPSGQLYLGNGIYSLDE